jgi:WS/DGAT/MGAT family acyltransferase
MALHRMSPVDAAWFHMDGRANLAMVTSVMLTAQPLDFDRVKALYAARLARFDRFRQRVVEHGFPLPVPHWEDVPDFDIGQHLHHIALPRPRDRRALTRLLSDLVSTPLDPLQPLWQAHLVDDVDGGSALVTRFHHCLGDGTAMTALAQELFDVRADAPLEGKHLTAPARRTPRAGGVTSVFDGLGASARALWSTADATLQAVRHPQALIDQAARIVSGAGMVLQELLKADDPASPFKGRFALPKQVAWSDPVTIDDAKAIGALAGAKVNDVLVAAMAGALRAYLRGRGVDVDHTTLRAMVPVDLRPPERALELGNDFGLVILDLPVARRTALARLQATKAGMDALKRSAEPVAMRVLFDIFGRTPKAVQNIPVSMFGGKASVVMTNVAGARQTLYLTGVPIEHIVFWVPHPGEQLGLGISIQSYRGQATLAVVADAGLVPDPEAITRRFNREFATLLSAARRAPAPAPASTLKRVRPTAKAPPRRGAGPAAAARGR